MGPKMATENKRNFTEEDIRKGRDGQIGLQVSFYNCSNQRDEDWLQIINNSTVANLRHSNNYSLFHFRLAKTKEPHNPVMVVWETQDTCEHHIRYKHFQIVP